ncbi:class 1 fructose-bisphosphatase [Candidatus Ichthyocystis sparus]|nr:class 1 fructose-bisphosphatase [Candidatus Ichthyocystis sparus]
MDLFSVLQLESFEDEFLIMFSHLVGASIDVSKTLSTSMGNCNENPESFNVHGEIQKSLDIYSHERFCDILTYCPQLLAIASEESKHPVFQSHSADGTNYILAIDPLDGSSNLDMNVSVGTIFSIFVVPDKHHGKINYSDEIFFRPGIEQFVAGYFIYGPMTQLVLTWGNGTHVFTLDKDELVYRLSQHSIKIPETTSEFSINVSNRRFWSEPIKEYVEQCLLGDTGPRNRHFNMRWVASMVADIHRLLMRGGIFLYPSDSREKTKLGRLRLLYEVSPISWIVEQAGGLTTDGNCHSLLSIVPNSIHQRVSVIVGSKAEVSYLKSMFSE